MVTRVGTFQKCIRIGTSLTTSKIKELPATSEQRSVNQCMAQSDKCTTGSQISRMSLHRCVYLKVAEYLLISNSSLNMTIVALLEFSSESSSTFLMQLMILMKPTTKFYPTLQLAQSSSLLHFLYSKRRCPWMQHLQDFVSGLRNAWHRFFKRTATAYPTANQSDLRSYSCILSNIHSIQVHV